MRRPLRHWFTTGSDSSDGSEANPWQSLQFAISQLTAGDTLFIKEGHYEGYAVLSNSGTQDNLITIEGIGEVVFDATNLTYPNPNFPSEILKRVIFDTGGQDYITFRNIQVINAGGPGGILDVSVGPAGKIYVTMTSIFRLNYQASPGCVTDFCGVANGQAVSGIINVRPNLTLHPNTRKVFYYLNGSQSGKYYAAPFTWGGTGFDTRTLANGTYTLAGTYTDNTGDHPFSITFTVSNP